MRAGVLRAFYVRRALRIFPAYYIVLATAAGLSPMVREAWGWHAAYLTNMHVAARGAWGGARDHAWSLAVEEQFYLLWPWIVLYTPGPWLPRVITATLVPAPLSRLLLDHRPVRGPSGSGRRRRGSCSSSRSTA